MLVWVMQMKAKQRKFWVYAVSIAAALAVGGLSAVVNAGRFMSETLRQPPLLPPPWLFPIVWTILFILMGISAARVYRSGAPCAGDALFLYAVQLLVNFLWTVFYFSFGAYLLAFFWLLFLLLLVALMLARFERAAPGVGKLQLPYAAWLLFAAYLNFGTWLLNH